jgi:hypothetical protein
MVKYAIKQLVQKQMADTNQLLNLMHAPNLSEDTMQQRGADFRTITS